MSKGSKRKGSNAERELVRMFWENGWAAMRSAGSGSQQYPSPDILVGKEGRRLAIECKLTNDLRKYLSLEEVKQLDYFAKKLSCETWIAVKFTNLPWYFFNPEDIPTTDKNVVITPNLAELKGLTFEELIEG